MANLGTYVIKNDGYQNVETVTGLTFTSTHKYRIQSQNHAFWLREGTTGKGDYVQAFQFAYYTDAGNDLYVCPTTTPLELNIAEYTDD